MRVIACTLLLLTPLAAAAAEASYCADRPSKGPSLSIGSPSNGLLRGARELKNDATVRILPLRHQQRCLNFGTERLITALQRAGRSVQSRSKDSPPLGVGDLSRATGGPIPAYSHSHQSGRDADLSFYALDSKGRPTPLDDLVPFDGSGRAKSGQQFDARRTWLLTRALLEDATVDVQWLFISNELKKLVLVEAKKDGAPPALLTKAETLLHQPSDAPPHDDHLHVRIRCTAEERIKGCRG
jgi:penicillin-insensitive murein endopeptidase